VAARPPPRHPLLGSVEEDDLDSLIGTAWDEELQAPVPPARALPPVSVAQLAEDAEPGLGTLLRRVGAVALRRLARRLDPPPEDR